MNIRGQAIWPVLLSIVIGVAGLSFGCSSNNQKSSMSSGEEKDTIPGLNDAGTPSTRIDGGSQDPSATRPNFQLTGGTGPSAADGSIGTGPDSQVSNYPTPIQGSPVRIDKPVLFPQPGHMIFPDDKPADVWMTLMDDPQLWTSFVLANSNLTDNGMKAIPRFRALNTLDVSNTSITDAGIAWLRDAQAIRVLKLANTRVTDIGLEHLKAIPTLEEVWLAGTETTSEGITRLRAARPELRIVL